MQLAETNLLIYNFAIFGRRKFFRVVAHTFSTGTVDAKQLRAGSSPRTRHNIRDQGVVLYQNIYIILSELEEKILHVFLHVKSTSLRNHEIFPSVKNFPLENFFCITLVQKIQGIKFALVSEYEVRIAKFEKISLKKYAKLPKPTRRGRMWGAGRHTLVQN